ncbi:DUF4126 domain-containing protein [Miltoncostaea marina]|uniref:DUF4126 domain-containing protein n=1 Tax=Miltoncostaea marina TaxID=2843215 RepID=UPI001C3CFCA9|nr:DUF4126 domain-containing protein [Miltoncostaea marina]
MDPATAIGSVFAAVGLSGAAGLNAYLPLLAGALLERLGVVELGEPFGALSSDAGIAVLAALLAADVVADKVPGVDHLLHVAGAVIHPVAGALLFVGGTGPETGIPAAVAAILGAATAETVHGGRAALRPASTATTAGVGNPVLSLAEDLGSLALTVLAFAAPLVALLVVLALLAAAIGGVRRLVGAAARRPRGRG